jgi:hypothetical protein
MNIICGGINDLESKQLKKNTRSSCFTWSSHHVLLKKTAVLWVTCCSYYSGKREYNRRPPGEECQNSHLLIIRQHGWLLNRWLLHLRTGLKCYRCCPRCSNGYYSWRSQGCPRRASPPSLWLGVYPCVRPRDPVPQFLQLPKSPLLTLPPFFPGRAALARLSKAFSLWHSTLVQYTTVLIRPHFTCPSPRLLLMARLFA